MTRQTNARTLYLGIRPVMRMYMQGKAVAGETPLEIGDVLHGRGVAQVVAVARVAAQLRVVERERPQREDLGPTRRDRRTTARVRYLR